MKKIVFGLSGISILIWGVGFLLFQLMNARNFQIAGELHANISTQEKIVALTFDDGPNEHTASILSVLKEKNIPTTFFLIGQEIEKHPSYTHKIALEGHELGNHSYSHERMILKSESFVSQEIEKTDALIRQASYSGEIHFRPPFGKKLFVLPWYLARHNKKTITWNVEPNTVLPVTASSEEITSFVKTSVQPGSIILLHPWYGEVNASRDAIPMIVDALHQDGYAFVTVSELLKKHLP